MRSSFESIETDSNTDHKLSDWDAIGCIYSWSSIRISDVGVDPLLLVHISPLVFQLQGSFLRLFRIFEQTEDFHARETVGEGGK